MQARTHARIHLRPSENNFGFTHCYQIRIRISASRFSYIALSLQEAKYIVACIFDGIFVREKKTAIVVFDANETYQLLDLIQLDRQ